MFKKILLTTDGSSLAEEALPTAISLAQSCQGELRCLAIVEASPAYGPPGAPLPVGTSLWETLETELHELAEAGVERAAARVKEAGVPVSTAVRRGPLVDEIVNEAKSWSADVIVTSTHGRTGISQFLLGSVATKIIHHAPCPVLLHRAKDSSS